MQFKSTSNIKMGDRNDICYDIVSADIFKITHTYHKTPDVLLHIVSTF